VKRFRGLADAVLEAQKTSWGNRKLIDYKAFQRGSWAKAKRHSPKTSSRVETLKNISMKRPISFRKFRKKTVEEGGAQIKMRQGMKRLPTGRMGGVRGGKNQIGSKRGGSY